MIDHEEENNTSPCLPWANDNIILNGNVISCHDIEGVIMIIKPTKKELERGCVNNGKKYTVVTRPQANDLILVAAVYENGEIVDDTQPLYVKKKNNICDAIREILRWIDKMGGDSPMASRSRFRK